MGKTNVHNFDPFLVEKYVLIPNEALSYKTDVCLHVHAAHAAYLVSMITK